MMTWLHHWVSSTSAMLVFFGPIAACSSDGSESGGTGRSSEAFSCGASCNPTPSPTLDQPDCLVNPYCAARPKTSAGFDPLVLRGLDTDPTFSDRLAASGCEPEVYYSPAAGLGLTDVWGTAICPSTFTESAADLAAGTSGAIACDSCTGDPGPGRIVIAWLVNPPPCTIGPRGSCGVPGPNCSDVSCLVQEQQSAASSGAGSVGTDQLSLDNRARR